MLQGRLAPEEEEGEEPSAGHSAARCREVWRSAALCCVTSEPQRASTLDVRFA